MRLVNLFNNATLYNVFQSAISRGDTSRIVRDEVLRPNGIQDVLDFGCGIGSHAVEFPKSSYLGIEPLPQCIKKANDLFGGPNRRFVLGNHKTLREIPDKSFDLIIAIGVLHHMNDEVVSEFIAESVRLLRSGGRLTTFDPVIHAEQSMLSRWIVKRDRGQWVRTVSDYSDLLTSHFPWLVRQKIYTNLLRIPYDHINFNLYK